MELCIFYWCYINSSPQDLNISVMNYSCIIILFTCFSNNPLQVRFHARHNVSTSQLTIRGYFLNECGIENLRFGGVIHHELQWQIILDYFK